MNVRLLLEKCSSRCHLPRPAVGGLKPLPHHWTLTEGIRHEQLRLHDVQVNVFELVPNPNVVDVWPAVSRLQAHALLIKQISRGYVWHTDGDVVESAPTPPSCSSPLPRAPSRVIKMMTLDVLGSSAAAVFNYEEG